MINDPLQGRTQTFTIWAIQENLDIVVIKKVFKNKTVS